MSDTIRGLAAKWREISKRPAFEEFSDGSHAGYENCADELDALADAMDARLNEPSAFWADEVTTATVKHALRALIGWKP